MITCYLRTLKREYKAENEWNQLATLIKANELDIYAITAKIVITDKDTDDMSFEDAMEPLIRSLLLISSQKLLIDEDYNFGYWDYEGNVYMHNEQDQVTIEGDFLGTATYSKQQLIKSFLDSAVKMMKLMRDLHEISPDFEFKEAHAQFVELYDEAQSLYKQRFG